MPSAAPIELQTLPTDQETQEEFVVRAHQELAQQVPDPVQRSELIWEIWSRTRGPTPEEQIAVRCFPPQKYVQLRNVCLFAEHEATDATGQPRKYDLEGMILALRGSNRRILDHDGFAPISDGHTPTPESPDQRQPDILGYVGPYRLGMIGRVTPRWAVFADEYHLRECQDRLDKLPRRSVELWTFRQDPHRMYFDPIAALGAETPRLQLPTRYQMRGDAEVHRYSMALPGASNTFIQQPVKAKAKPKVARNCGPNCKVRYEWQEKLHPRATDGKFTGKGQDRRTGAKPARVTKAGQPVGKPKLPKRITPEYLEQLHHRLLVEKDASVAPEFDAALAQQAQEWKRDMKRKVRRVWNRLKPGLKKVGKAAVIGGTTTAGALVGAKIGRDYSRRKAIRDYLAEVEQQWATHPQMRQPAFAARGTSGSTTREPLLRRAYLAASNAWQAQPPTTRALTAALAVGMAGVAGAGALIRRVATNEQQKAEYERWNRMIETYGVHKRPLAGRRMSQRHDAGSLASRYSQPRNDRAPGPVPRLGLRSKPFGTHFQLPESHSPVGAGEGSSLPSTSQSEENNMALSNDDIAQIMEALASTPQFQFLTELMNSEETPAEQGAEAPPEEGYEDLMVDEGAPETMPEEAPPEEAPLEEEQEPEQNALPAAAAMAAKGLGTLGAAGKAALATTGGKAAIGGLAGGYLGSRLSRRASGQQPDRYSQLRGAHNRLVQEHGRLASRFQGLLREKSDAERAAVLHQLAGRYPDFVDLEGELSATLYSQGSSMDDDAFQAHVAHVERYAAKAESYARTHARELPEGTVERLRPNGQNDRHAAKLAQEAVRIYTQALNAGEAMTYEQAKEKAAQAVS